MRIGVHGLCEIAFTENAKHLSRCMRIFSHITEMAVVWKEQLSMNINSNLQFKSIKFLDGVKDLNSNDGWS